MIVSIAVIHILPNGPLTRIPWDFRRYLSNTQARPWPMKNVVIAITDRRRLSAYIVTMWKRVDMKNVARMWMGRPNFANGPDQYRNGSCYQSLSQELEVISHPHHLSSAQSVRLTHLVIPLSPELVQGRRLDEPPIRYPRPFFIHVIPDPNHDKGHQVCSRLEPKYHPKRERPSEECPHDHPIDPIVTGENFNPIHKTWVIPHIH